jgi:hypothetical protein
MRYPGRICWLVASVVFAGAVPALPSQYEVIFENGESMTGDQLVKLHAPVGAALDGRELFAPIKSARLVRNLRERAVRRGPCVEFTNGDVLPGQIVRWAPPSSGAIASPHFLIATGDAENADLFADIIAVRAECVARQTQFDFRSSRLEPGLVVTRDGRQLHTRSISFEGTRISALKESGIEAFDFADLKELHLSSANSITDVMRDGAWSTVGAASGVTRIVTNRGAEITYAGPMATLASLDRPRADADSAHLAIRPAWALETLFVRPQNIVSYSYRRPEEAPLSLLPVQVLAERSMLHYWRWRRNANVQGLPLQSGRLAFELGIGMHAYSAVAFTLPPGAHYFNAWVGLDSSVNDGGCVECRIHRDDVDGPVMWKSDFLRGGEEPVRISSLDIAGAQRIVLVADFGHEGRPEGADPWDVCDHVAWLDPTITIDPEQLPRPTMEPDWWIPQLTGWEIPQDMRARMSLRPFWDLWRKQWNIAMTTDQPGVDAPFELTRQLRVDLTNAVLPISAANDNRGKTRHTIYVQVDGAPVTSTQNGAIHTRYTRRFEAESREWTLAPFRDKRVQLSVLIEPLNVPDDDPMGLLWENLTPRPLVDNLPSDGQPIAPDVPLTALTPVSAASASKKLELHAGKLTSGKPLEIRGWRFEDGFGVPTGSEITYRLDPQWTRFVAILGLAEGWKGVGPYSILLDGELRWECQTPLIFLRGTPALQIDVPLPPGHQTITLRAGGDDSYAAWACAGFVTSP